MTDNEDREQLDEWLIGRPQAIRDLAERFPPWAWFRLSTDERPEGYAYHPVGYAEDGTLQLRRYSVASGVPMWEVFGIEPGDLVPCESPEEQRKGWPRKAVREGTAHDAERIEWLREIARERADAN